MEKLFLLLTLLLILLLLLSQQTTQNQLPIASGNVSGKGLSTSQGRLWDYTYLFSQEFLTILMRFLCFLLLLFDLQQFHFTKQKPGWHYLNQGWQRLQRTLPLRR